MALSSKRAPLAGRRKSTENVEKATKYGSSRNVARLKGVRSSYSIEPRNLFTTP